MPSEFITIFLTMIFGLIVLGLVFAGVDGFFNLNEGIDRSTIINMNMLFVLCCAVLLVLSVLVGMVETGIIKKIFPNYIYRSLVWGAVVVICLYFVKSYLYRRYGLEFSTVWFVITVELLMLPIIPYIGYLYLKQFGKAFKN